MFTPVSARAASSYRQVSAVGASPHQLVSMLFEALLQSVNAARNSVLGKDFESKGRHITRAIRLLDEGLLSALDDAQGGELAANLRGLYRYSMNRLTLANLRNDEALLSEVIGLIEPIAQSWRQIGAAVAAGPANAAAAASAV